MTSKKWLLLFLATVLALGAGVLGLNYLVNPFGVFSHSALSWPSYEMTINPRTAKMTYLKDHHQEYDSYILGCSSTSSFPVDALNRYLDANFYNMIVYGADMLDLEQQATYLIDHYTVKNLVVNVYLDNALSYDVQADPLSYAMPAELTGEPMAPFLAKYLFLDPRHSLDKLKAMGQDTYLTQSFDVFNARTGAYDKIVRDAEGIGDLDRYLEAYPGFANYPVIQDTTRNDAAVSATMESLARVRDLCESRGIRFLVLSAPVYWEYYDDFDFDQVADFYTRLAQVTPYWDFSFSSISYEPRYFYDETHFRNCVGDMALARVFGDDSRYIPRDFGVYVTPETVADHLADLSRLQPAPAKSYTAQVPVLLYHHLAPEVNDQTVITPALFEQQMAALSRAGYTAVLPEDLQAYVNQGASLPDKPILITFDDGYLSNYEYAWPILQKYGMRATIFVIGSTIGQTEHYKDTQHPITPHFSLAQAQEMIDSGVISIQSHTYDMHQWGPFETSDAPRENILALPGESEDAYRTHLSQDCQAIRETITQGTSETNVHVMAYPGGYSDPLAQVTLLENEFDILFTTDSWSNTIVRGLPQSLLGLGRFNMNQSVSVEQTLTWVADARG